MNEYRLLPDPRLLLGLALAGAAVLTFTSTEGHNLYADEVQVLSTYRDWDPGTLLKAAGGHLIITTLFLYKAIFGIFGADSYLPNRILHVGFALLCGLLFYALARKRVSKMLALAPTTVLLFLGSGAEIVATPFGVLGYVGIACGLAMFLALEREDRTGDVLAALFLTAGLASYSINVAFGVGAAVWIWQRGARPGGDVGRWQSAWVVVAPAILYGIWRLTELEPGETNLSAANAFDIPTAILTSLAAACASITGLFRVPSGGGPAGTVAWGYPLAAAAIAAVIWRFRSGPPVNRRIWVWFWSLLSFWVLVGLNLGPLREPEASRYVYIGVLLLLLMAVELVRGLPMPRWAGWTIAAVVGASVLANGVALKQAGDTYADAGTNLSAQLAAVDIAGEAANQDATILALPENVPVVQDLKIPVRDYREATADFGSPAFSEAELLASDEVSKSATDLQLIRLLGLNVAPAPRMPTGCSPVIATSAGAASIMQVPPGELYVAANPKSPVSVGVRRFSDGTTIPLRGVAAGGIGVLTIPADRSQKPWTAVISSPRLKTCAVSG